MAASAALRALVESTAPSRPYCGYDKLARIRPLKTALGMPYLQLNPPALAHWLIIDIDHDMARHAPAIRWKPRDPLTWERIGVPAPTFLIFNPANGHVQMGYSLSAPVCTSDAGRAAPLRYLAAIETGYNKRLGGDVGFTGLLSKNPLADCWHCIEPANCAAYELGELARDIELPKRLPKRREASEAAGLGRNCALFDSLSTWARRAIRGFWRPGGADVWARVVRDEAESMNSFLVPLSTAEVAGIARSVARWSWKNVTPGGFREWQSAMGQRSGAARRRASEDRRDAARLMSAAGRSSREIAAVLCVNQSTVVRWLQG